MRKTGLGSSATLTSSFIASLFVYFGIFTPLENGNLTATDKNFLHNLAQIVHCAAQGKIGSGFDVSSAIFGSQIYSRFTPDLINPLLSKLEQEENSSQTIQEVLELCENSQCVWDQVVFSFQLPPFVKIVLGDINYGSDTPSMVSKFLSWKASSDKACK
jgi:phosphomevalonate kinase